MSEKQEKRLVALTSVLAAVFLTCIKIIIGLSTGSLGILSEALHSGLDLVAALLTLFAVKIADKPADKDHHFGHGKVENLSALLQTILLLITCFWIISEAMDRLILGTVEIEVNFWSFAVVIISIIIDISRSRALSRTAKKYDSQALEADALHFSTDILSSFVVIIGLAGAAFHYHFADPVAALFVAIIVVYISYRIGKKSIDVLLDKSPPYSIEQIKSMAYSVPEVTTVHDVKLRSSGSYTFIEMNIHVDPNLNIEQAHKISHRVSESIRKNIIRSDIHVHIEPEI